VNRPLNVPTYTMTLDGDEVTFHEGETIYEVAQRRGQEIPTLCYDDRLEAWGGCRLCVVEVEGLRGPVASCTTKASPGMVVRTRTEPIEKHRKTLLELVASENPDEHAVSPLRGYASQEMVDLLDEYGVKGDRFHGKQSGQSRFDDDNPFILRDYDRCISCYRCVRVCDEREGDFAISIKNRGFGTQITVEFDGELNDGDCTFCGQCVQTCPTGALADKKALRFEDDPQPITKTRSVCTYCGVGCSVDIETKGNRIVGVQPAMDGPANEGALCVKGQFAFDFVQHRDRLKTPLVRKDGKLVPTTWDAALDKAAAGFRDVLDEKGRKALYAIASGRAPSESAYLTQKFIRAQTGTHQVDNCSRG
jgi:predicted molibdopterin-dependent oxidoreductase YjgC